MTMGAPPPDQFTLEDLTIMVQRWADAGLRTLDQIPARIAWVTKTVTSTYSMLPFDRVILADATGGPFTVTLPSAVGKHGQQPLVVKRISAANTVTIASASGNIDGASTVALTSQYALRQVASDGTNWQVIASV